MKPAVEPESLPVCAQVLKWNLGAGKDIQVWILCGGRDGLGCVNGNQEHLSHNYEALGGVLGQLT